MADQIRDLDRQQRPYEEEVAEDEERYQVEVAAHREASRALATATQRFPDVVPAFLDWFSAHFRVMSGPVFDQLLEAWVRDDRALFEDNCENLSVFAFPTRQPPSTRARGRICGVSYDNWSAVLARDQRSQSPAVPTLPTLTSQSGAAPYQGSPGPTSTMILVTGASSGAADASVSTKSGSSMNPGTTGTESADASSSLGSTSGLRGEPQGRFRPQGLRASTPPSKRPSPNTSTQLTKKDRRSDPDAAGPLGASLPPRAIRRMPPWSRGALGTNGENWTVPSGRFGRTDREVEALMGPLLGIAGSLFRVVQAYGVQLLCFLCYPHSYWPEFIREGVWPVVPFLSRSKPLAPPFMSVLSWLHGRTLRAKLLKRFAPGNPAVSTREAISSAIGWMIQEAISARDAGNVGGVIRSSWARIRIPQSVLSGHVAPLGIPTLAVNPVVLDDSSEGSRADVD
ncbi:hypothetical protein H257_01065 [Aphanomyces astaci]|uniref:Uncharacterized protein n=1 Tax=Aphanomyces astaci TaxID=112090 RepID=W4H8B7_APHAT|nr:hypothetical protein H257_01065 [Aphanomyces astaci]ETV87524.1 hypothetical protein H257_01065 [Aphanomyces astaci]|eukprot:XP_009822387.1 hypothetical protein H257_01065 [Aphanomyces astaci]